EIQITRLNQRLVDSELGIQVTKEVLDHISKIGYDPVYGARPLKRAIQNWIENPLAQEVLKGEYVPGDRIAVELNSANELLFGKVILDEPQAVA
ncbi:MAG: hypothetical protein ACJZ8E_05630, partial [Pseudohongiellaceae bacterium]